MSCHRWFLWATCCLAWSFTISVCNATASSAKLDSLRAEIEDLSFDGALLPWSRKTSGDSVAGIRLGYSKFRDVRKLFGPPGVIYWGREAVSEGLFATRLVQATEQF